MKYLEFIFRSTPSNEVTNGVLSAVLGLAVCYSFGTAWFVLMYAATSGPIGVVSALWSCVIPFLIPDAIKLALALVLSRRLAPAVAKAAA